MNSEAKPGKQRMRERRERVKKHGGVELNVMLDSVARASLDKLVAGGMSKSEAVNKALTMLASQR